MRVVRHAQTCPKLWQLVNRLYFKNELSYKVGFFACGKKLIEVTNLFNHFK